MDLLVVSVTGLDSALAKAEPIRACGYTPYEYAPIRPVACKILRSAATCFASADQCPWHRACSSTRSNVLMPRPLGGSAAPVVYPRPQNLHRPHLPVRGWQARHVRLEGTALLSRVLAL